MGFDIHPQLIFLAEVGHEEDGLAGVVMDDSHAVGLFDSEEVPEGRLLLDEVLNIVIVFVEGFDAFPETDGGVFGVGLLQFGEEALSEFEVEIGGDFGCVDGL